MPDPGGCYVLVYEEPNFMGPREFINGPGKYATLGELAISRELAAPNSQCPGWTNCVGRDLGRQRIAGRIADAIAG